MNLAAFCMLASSIAQLDEGVDPVVLSAPIWDCDRGERVLLCTPTFYWWGRTFPAKSTAALTESHRTVRCPPTTQRPARCCGERSTHHWASEPTT
jgi:hypothetical protein